MCCVVSIKRPLGTCDIRKKPACALAIQAVSPTHGCSLVFQRCLVTFQKASLNFSMAFMFKWRFIHFIPVFIGTSLISSRAQRIEVYTGPPKHQARRDIHTCKCLPCFRLNMVLEVYMMSSLRLCEQIIEAQC